MANLSKTTWQARWFNLAMWAAIITLLVLFLKAVEPILLPFILGVFVAYLMDPIASKLQKWGLGRTGAAALLTVGLFTAIVMLVIWLAPLLYNQMSDLMIKAPQLLHHVEESLRNRGTPVLESLNKITGGNDPSAIPTDASALIQRGIATVSTFGQHLFASGAAFINVVALLLISPIVCFYMIRDWALMMRGIDRLLPISYAPIIREQIHQINRTLSAYMRGQITVMLLLSAYYVLTFWVAGLNYALALGVMAGCIVIIPYIGSVLSVALGLTVAYSQFGVTHDWWIIVGIYGFGQILESQFLTPKIIGDRVGLHPVWLLFGVLAGAALLGFAGVLLAVPLTAVVGVLVKFAIGRYLESGLYKE